MSQLKCLRPRLAPAQAQTGWKPDSQRGNRHQRGYGWGWEQTRERILERDAGLCQEHKRRGQIVAGREVDHITPKALGGTDSDANLQTLCTECHRTKTARESRGAQS